jgi:hypothetical protein
VHGVEGDLVITVADEASERPCAVFLASLWVLLVAIPSFTLSSAARSFSPTCFPITLASTPIFSIHLLHLNVVALPLLYSGHFFDDAATALVEE